MKAGRRAAVLLLDLAALLAACEEGCRAGAAQETSASATEVSRDGRHVSVGALRVDHQS